MLGKQEEINQQRANPTTDEDEGGNDLVHDPQATTATENDECDDCGEFIDIRNLRRRLTPCLPRHPCVRRLSLFKPRCDERDLYCTEWATRKRLGSPTYARRFKTKKALICEEQVAERLIYFRIFDSAKHERSANVDDLLDGLLAALEDKHLEIKDKTAREKLEREHRKAETTNKNGKGDKGKDKANI
eukprot:jgi/Tetstr1/432760/TSEL_022126.t1